MNTFVAVLTGLGVMLCSAVAASAAQVTFQLNMSAQISLGNFHPASDTVSAAEEFNGGSTSDFLLTQDASSPGLWVWVGTRKLTGPVNSPVLHKFVVNSSTWEADVGPNGTQNRSYTFVSTDPQTLPPVYFSNVNDFGPLSIGAVSGDQLTLSWTAGPGIRLQTTTDLRSSP